MTANRQSQDNTINDADLRRLFFDEKWIAFHHPELIREMNGDDFESSWTWYNETGYLLGLSPSPLFNVEVYASNGSGYSIEHGISPVRHYQSVNANQRVSPCLLFHEQFYRRRYPDIQTAVQEGKLCAGLIHYLIFEGKERRRPHPLFSRWACTLGDNTKSVETLESVLTNPQKDAVTMSGLFDAAWYRYQALDSGLDPDSRESLIEHFLLEGLDQAISPLPDFDSTHYCSSHPDVEEGITAGTLRSAVWHWLFFGAPDDRAPNSLFDPAYYLSRNPAARGEIARYGLLCAFEHFLLIGKARGWKCKPPLMSLKVSEPASQIAMARRAAITASQVCRYRSIRFANPVKPNVSVIIPVHNQFDFTLYILAQLSKAADALLEVIVVDNLSTDRTRELDRHVSGINVLRAERNLGFPEGCNLGAEHASADVLLFLNNDIELGYGSIDQALGTLLADAGIGAVGGRVVRSHGLLQEAGSVVFSDGSSRGIGRGENPLDSAHSLPRDVDFCSGCFLMVRKSVFDEIDGFDEAYSPGYYEETDACVRIRDLGYRVVYDPAALVFHYEYGSFASGRPRTVSTALMRKNQETFVNKHASSLRQYPLPGEHLPLQGTASNQKRLLMVEDYPPLQELGSGFGRANAIARQLVAMGFAVEILALFEHEVAHGDAVYSGLPGIPVHHLGGLSRAEAFFADYAAHFDVVWLCRTHNAIRLHKALQKMRTTTRQSQMVVLDTEALATNRMREMARVLGPSAWSEQEFRRQLQKELRAAKIFDRIVAVNRAEAELIRSVVNDSQVDVVTNHAELAPEGNKFADRRGFVFLGAIHSSGTPNFDSLEWFCTSVWPRLSKAIPDACLSIAGFWHGDVPIPEWMMSPSIRHVGAVSEVGQILNAGRVFVAPTRFSAGIPIKIIESAQYGLPCVVSSILAQQLGWDDDFGSMISALKTSEFVKRCTALHGDEALWNKAHDMLSDWVQREFSTEVFQQSIRQIIGNNN